ncbi:MAG: diacylglycerol/lipid kinase family protein [Bacteroidia bacterium]
MKTKLIFIVNPISGGIKKDYLPRMIEKYIDREKFQAEIWFTNSADHTIELSKKAVVQNVDVVVAVGGDGTINSIAKHLKDTPVILGILPMGSGNGLARHLQVPMNPQKALQLIQSLNYSLIDTGTVNDRFFINVTGAGFDAKISKLFATSSKRGFLSYIQITLDQFANYISQTYELTIDGIKSEEQAFIICVANGSQYGNNAFIAPGANSMDGIFDISVLKPFRLLDFPVIAYQLFTKKFGRSKFVKTLKGKSIQIKRPTDEAINIDGEPVMTVKDLEIKMFPKSLKVITGLEFQV